MKLIICALLFLQALILLLVYDGIDNRVSLLEQKYLEPQPLFILQPEKYAITEIYFGGEKAGMEMMK